MEVTNSLLQGLSLAAKQLKYHPLQVEKQEVRLVKIRSISGKLGEDATAELTMETVSLMNPPPFISLSYVWGEPARNHSVSCNGGSLEVTESLLKTLRTVFVSAKTNDTGLYNRGDHPSFWIDGICINQDDEHEKVAQIPLMSKIYRKSKGTVACIGSPADGSDPNDGFIAMVVQYGPSTLLPDATGALKMPSLNSDALIQLYAQPFFGRSWMFQEMILSESVLCLYGTENKFASWDLDMFMKLWTPFYTTKTHIGPDPSTSIIAPKPQPDLDLSCLPKHSLNLEAWRYLRDQLLNSQNGFDPILPLSHSRRAAATDVRDKIYSILSLVKEDWRGGVVIDYSPSNTVINTFLDYATLCVSTGFGMALLEQAGTKQQMPGLPSWVPNWDTEARYEPSGYFRHFSCAGTTHAQMSVEDSTKLRISGWVMGDVAQVGMALNYGAGDLIPSMPQVKSMSQAVACLETNANMWCKMLCEDDFREASGMEDHVDAVWRTLWLDRNWLGERATATDRKYYDAWLAKYPRPEKESQAPRVTGDEVGAAQLFKIAATHMQGRALGMITGFRFIRVAALPMDAKVDDLVVIFAGCRCPYVIRPLENPAEFQLVGNCYVYGVMDGELLAETGDQGKSFTEAAIRDFILQ